MLTRQNGDGVAYRVDPCSLRARGGPCFDILPLYLNALCFRSVFVNHWSVSYFRAYGDVGGGRFGCNLWDRHGPLGAELGLAERGSTTGALSADRWPALAACAGGAALFVSGCLGLGYSVGARYAGAARRYNATPDEVKQATDNLINQREHLRARRAPPAAPVPRAIRRQHGRSRRHTGSRPPTAWSRRAARRDA